MKRLALLILLSVSAFSQLATYGLKRNVTTAGTAVRLSATSLIVRSLVIQAPSTNVGTIYIGGSDVLAATKNGVALTSTNSLALLPIGELKTINSYDLTNIWIDSTTSGEGVSVTYFK